MNRLRIAIAVCTALLHMAYMQAQDNSSALIPYPNSIVQSQNGKTFQISSSTAIKSNLPEEAFALSEARRVISRHTGIEPKHDNSRKKDIIELAIDTTIHGEEHYRLSVDKKGITIKGATEGALLWGIQTLDQILLGDICNTKAGKVEHVVIDDTPRYPHRAIMLDPARHFLPVKDIKFFKEVPLGSGSVDFAKYLKALEDIGYRGFLTIEREAGEDPAKDIGIAKDHLLKVIAEN